MPEVYWICTGSVGDTSGSGVDGFAAGHELGEALERDHVAEERQLGSTCSSDSCIGLPRKLGR